MTKKILVSLDYKIRPDSTIEEAAANLYKIMMVSGRKQALLYAVMAGHDSGKHKSFKLTVKLECSELTPDELGEEIEKTLIDVTDEAKINH